jgi:glycogen operon protein
MAKKIAVSPGRSSPLGATVQKKGVNFSLYSKHATAVELLLFNDVDDVSPAQAIPVDPVVMRTYHYWHAFVPKLKAGQLYAYRVTGPHTPQRGLRYDADKILLDPYGKGVVVPAGYSRGAACAPGEVSTPSMKNVVIDNHQYDWEGDLPLQRPSARTIIYEMHVRGFTRNPNSGVPAELRGTYAGLIEKIPYLQNLGITAVELLPVFHFDAQDAPHGKINYWGYAPLSFFAPHPQYSSRQDPLGPNDEFRDMVKALHRAGIEVILDVVFNHTAEGNERGPMLSFKGIDNGTYYMLESGGEYYANYTGCGNTFNANDPIARRLIIDSLRYWVQEMHVDGFRFDLASILCRDAAGHPLPNPPVLWDIESDPVLAGTKLLAEAWDAAGLYQVGSFVGDAWREWNGRFRDDVRDFFRGEPGAVRRLADRIVGSPQVYGHEEREAEQSVNFVTCHDGFTLNDLVSYNDKHNEANGEGNRDGASDNRSWNCGAEGPTDDPAIERLRNRQVKNFLATNLLSLGLPMLLMGDEMRQTQRGNNNAYCHDNELSWLDWSLLDRHPDVLRFVSLLCARRAQRVIDHEQQRVSINALLREANESWHGVKLNQPDWSDSSRSIALSGELKRQGLHFHLMLNAFWEPLTFELPILDGLNWCRWIDTARNSPDDICNWERAPKWKGATYEVADRSVVMLIAAKG